MGNKRKKKVVRTLIEPEVYTQPEQEDNDFSIELRNLGITNIENLDSDDIEKLLYAGFINNEVNKNIVKKYLEVIPLETFYNSLKTFAATNKDLSKQTLTIINNAIEILGKDLERELSKEERERTQAHIIQLINTAVDQRREDRKFGDNLARYGLAAMVIAAGVVVFAITGGRNKEVLEKGIKTLK